MILFDIFPEIIQNNEVSAISDQFFRQRREQQAFIVHLVNKVVIDIINNEIAKPLL